MKKNNKKELNEAKNIIHNLDGTFPHQINAPSFKGTGIKMQPPFINSHGVVIGDSKYASEQSPLENWSKDIDPEIMAGEEWIHPTNDIGWNSSENRALLEKKRAVLEAPFMHPTKDSSYGKD